jgi:hypothetical protein
MQEAMELALYEWNLAGGEMLYKTVETVYTHQFKFFFLLSSYRLHGTAPGQPSGCSLSTSTAHCGVVPHAL